MPCAPTHEPKESRSCPGRWILAGAALVLVLALGGLTAYAALGDDGSAEPSTATTIPQPTPAQLAAAGLEELPLAPRASGSTS